MSRVCAFAAARCAFAVVLAPTARADGSFASSDDLVDLIWQSSVRTAGDMVSPPVNLDPRAYWVEALYQYTLYSGNLAPLKRVYPNLQRLIDGLYPRHVGSDGLLVNWLGADDYAFIPRRGTRVAYYNAQYVRALREAAALAGWLNDVRPATVWRARAQQLAGRFASAFWDPSVGAFQDTTEDDDVHPQDGNAFAILAGLASPSHRIPVTCRGPRGRCRRRTGRSECPGARPPAGSRSASPPRAGRGACARLRAAASL